MKYAISYQNPNRHFIDIVLTIDNISEEILLLQLPAWRPGRYEMANFSRNIQKIGFFNGSGRLLPFKKVSRDLWEVETSGAESVVVKYNYYAFLMDAGNSWLDDNQLYINFINCLIYSKDHINEECIVKLKLPDDYEIACGLEQKNKHTLTAPDYYRLVDCPMIASNSLKHLTYRVRDHLFHIWIQGEAYFNEEKLIQHFRAFTECQIEIMKEFPCEEYHFLFQILPYKHYHGVEHFNSTVITLGPGEKFNTKEFYQNLVGVSSHELFHTWNIIRIRPQEMMPYDFSKENYFTTGFIAEGFTTYYGELFLAKSGVFSIKDYLGEINKILFRHFDNFGRYNLSLADSSLDLWVDGYSAGIPDRKVSIYVTGAVTALILDLSLRKESNNEMSLDVLMRELWQNFGKKKKGYSMDDFQAILDRIDIPVSKTFIQDFIYKNTPAEPVLQELLPFFGCRLELIENLSHEGQFGFKAIQQEEITKISMIQPGSIAEEALSREDELIAVNGRKIEKNLEELIGNKKEVALSLFRNKELKTVFLRNTGQSYFQNWRIIQNPETKQKEKENFEKWAGSNGQRVMSNEQWG